MNADVQEKYKRNYIIEQLHKFKYYEVEGKSYRELKSKLAALRATAIEVK